MQTNYSKLRPDVLTNHFEVTAPLTTKSGLLDSLKTHMIAEGNIDPDTFLPFSIKIGKGEERGNFDLLFRTCACVEILKRFLAANKEAKKIQPEKTGKEKNIGTLKELFEEAKIQTDGIAEESIILAIEFCERVLEEKDKTGWSGLIDCANEEIEEEEEERAKTVCSLLGRRGRRLKWKGLIPLYVEPPPTTTTTSDDDEDDDGNDDETTILPELKPDDLFPPVKYVEPNQILSEEQWMLVDPKCVKDVEATKNKIEEALKKLSHESESIDLSGLLKLPFRALQSADTVFERMRKFTQATELLGDQNVWLMKPYAWSRGLGIECFNSLSDLTKHLKDAKPRFLVQV